MKTAAGMLGLVVMAAVIVVGTLAAFGGAFGPKAPQNPLNEASKTTAEKVTRDKQTAVALGDTVNAGDVSWTVTNARTETELNKDTPPPKPRFGNFVVVDYTVKNVSEEPVTLVAGDMAIIDNEGRSFPPEAAINSPYVPYDKNTLFNEKSLLQPGATEEGEVNFELPVGASGPVLQLVDTNPNVDEKQYVNLGL